MTDKAVIYSGRKTTRQLRKTRMIKDEHSVGFSSDPDGQEEVTYDVLIDLPAMSAMARKAAANKSGKATDGPLIVKVTGRRRLG